MVFWVLFLIRRLYHLESGCIFSHKNQKLENHILSDGVGSRNVLQSEFVCPGLPSIALVNLVYDYFDSE